MFQLLITYGLLVPGTCFSQLHLNHLVVDEYTEASMTQSKNATTYDKHWKLCCHWHHDVWTMQYYLKIYSIFCHMLHL